MRRFLFPLLVLLATASAVPVLRAQYYVSDPNATYLIAAFGCEEIYTSGFLYDSNANVIPFLESRYSDTTLKGDPSVYFPATYATTGRLYVDGSNLSSNWDAEGGLSAGGQVGGVDSFPASTVNQDILTTRRTTLSTPPDPLYNKAITSEKDPTLIAGETRDFISGVGLGFALGGGNRFSMRLNSAGYRITTATFAGAKTTAANVTITWFYSTDGSTLTATGVSTVVSAAAPLKHTVDLSAVAALDGAANVWLVGEFSGAGGAGIYLDNLQVIGAKAGGTPPTSPPTISGTATPTATVGTSYSYAFTVGGSPAPTLSVTAGALPPGIQISGTTLAGTPTLGGVYSGTLSATNTAGTATKDFSIIVSGPAALSGAPAAGTVGAAYTHTFTVGGYPTPTAVTLQSGALPPGLSLNGATLSGTPTTAGSFTFTVAATNATGTATLPVTQTINSLPTIAAPVSLTAVKNVAYSGTFALGGSPAPTTVTLQSGTLPPGLALSGANLAGTPTAAGTYAFTVTTTNVAGTATLPVTFDVQSVPAVTLPAGNAVVFATLTPAMAEIFADGLPAPTLTMTGAPAWLSLTTSTDASSGRTTGTLSGTPPVGAPAAINVDFHAANAAGTATVQTLAISILATTTAPSITTQPVGGNVALHGSFTFTVAASGVPTPTYQWRKDGNAIGGATASSYTVSDALAGSAGGYSVVVTNNTGTATSSTATLVVLVPVTITTQPVSTAVGVGDPVNLSVTATGLTPLTYQWRKDGVAIGGATASTFSIAGATLASAGSYDVVVTNPAGSVTSAAATVAVDSPPTITLQPIGGTFTGGTAFSLRVEATSVSSLTYQWRKNGVAIGGAIAQSLDFGAPAESDSGSYDVLVTNARGSVTSSAATVTVVSAPQVTRQPTSSLLVAGQSVSFEIAATPASAQFQWYRDGTAIDGATNAKLTLYDVSLADARAAYTCRVTNLAGTVTSSPGYVVVYSPASRVVPLAGGTFDFEVGAPAAFDGWSVAGDSGWLSPKRDGHTVKYTVPEAPGAVARTGRITLTVPGLAAASHTVDQREFVVLSGDFSGGLADWPSLGTNVPAVVTEVSGRRNVLGLGATGGPNAAPAAALAYAAVRSRSLLAAGNDRRVQADVFLAVGTAGANQAESFLALVDPAAAPTDVTATATEPASTLRVSLWHGGTDADSRLRGHTWINARFLGADGKYRSLNLATAVPSDELANKWVRFAADIGTDGKVSIWMDPEPFGDPVRVWSSTVAASPKLRGEQALLLGLRADGASNRPYQTSPVVSGGFAPRTVTNKIIGLSTRAWVGTGEQVAIAGIGSTGNGVDLLVRGVGPALSAYGLNSALPTPRLVAYDGSTPPFILRVQDGWEKQRDVETLELLRTGQAALGLFPLSTGAADSAFLQRAASGGLRTIHLKSVDGTATGEGLIEAYAYSATGNTSGGQLVAISTRAMVPKGVAMIPGLAVDGNASRLFLVRGVGPALAQYGIKQPLAAPQLELYRSAQRLAQNTKWGTASASSLLAAAGTQSGASALTAGSADSAVLVRMTPGNFTVPITSADGGEGVALAEIYALSLDADLDTSVE